MRRSMKSKFNPALETAEPRVLSTAGLASPLAPHPSAQVAAESHHAVVSAEAHHAVVTAEAHNIRLSAHQVSKVIHHPAPAHSTTTSTCHTTMPGAGASAPYVAQAWVKLVNTTSTSVNYQISLYPYQNGKYLSFTIGSGYPNPAQYQYAELTASGPSSMANFSIKFTGQPGITPLATGPTQASAQGYYIFLNTSGQYYLSAILP